MARRAAPAARALRGGACPGARGGRPLRLGGGGGRRAAVARGGPPLPGARVRRRWRRRRRRRGWARSTRAPGALPSTRCWPTWTSTSSRARPRRSSARAVGLLLGRCCSPGRALGPGSGLPAALRALPRAPVPARCSAPPPTSGRSPPPRTRRTASSTRRWCSSRSRPRLPASACAAAACAAGPRGALTASAPPLASRSTCRPGARGAASRPVPAPSCRRAGPPPACSSSTRGCGARAGFFYLGKNIPWTTCDFPTTTPSRRRWPTRASTGW